MRRVLFIVAALLMLSGPSYASHCCTCTCPDHCSISPRLKCAVVSDQVSCATACAAVYDCYNYSYRGVACEDVAGGSCDYAGVGYRCSVFTPTPTRTHPLINTSTPTRKPTPTRTLSPSPTVQRAPCPGDCRHRGSVQVADLVLGVNIALVLTPVSRCPAGDVNGDGVVQIDELIAAVNAALVGCP